VGSFILGRHYDCMNDTPMRALCGFVLWAESVIGTRIRACWWQAPARVYESRGSGRSHCATWRAPPLRLGPASPS